MAPGLTPASCEEPPSRQAFIMTIVFILWGASALAGLVIGLAFIRVLAIVLASPLVAFLSVAILFHHGFGLVHGVLISIGSLTALQSFYLAGTAIGYLMSNEVDDDRVSSGETMMRKPAAVVFTSLDEGALVGDVGSRIKHTSAGDIAGDAGALQIGDMLNEASGGGVQSSGPAST
jgi:hypothetical protein